MRISDWSSDVCSSDQARVHHAHVLEHAGVVGVVVAAVEAVGALDLRFAGRAARLRGARAGADRGAAQQHEAAPLADRVAVSGAFDALARSEERRGGKECVSKCRSRWSPYQSKKR